MHISQNINAYFPGPSNNHYHYLFKIITVINRSPTQIVFVKIHVCSQKLSQKTLLSLFMKYENNNIHNFHIKTFHQEMFYLMFLLKFITLFHKILYILIYDLFKNRFSCLFEPHRHLGNNKNKVIQLLWVKLTKDEQMLKLILEVLCTQEMIKIYKL